MAEQIYNVKCGFFDAINNDRVYTAEDMNRLYNRVIHDGVFPDENNNPSEDFLVEADSGMTIIVRTGEGVFASHWFKNSINIPIDIPPNSSNDRIDSIIIQVDTRKSGRAGNIVYRTGEPSINPVPPEINEAQSVVEYRLANISVTSGATAITSADITDLRGTSECPWVTGIISANTIPPNSITEAKLATDAVTTAKIKNEAVTGSKIATGTIETTNIGVKQVKTANIDDGAVTGTKIAAGTITSSNIGIGQVQMGNIDGGAVTKDKLDADSVSTDKIQDEAVTLNKLGTDAQAVINNKLPYQRLVKNTGGVPTALQVEDLNALTLDRNTFYYIWLAYGFLYPTQPREWAVILELESNNQLIITKNGDIYSREKVSGVWSDFINPLGNLLKTTDYSIGFNADGMAVKKTINKTLNIGEFGAETLKVYVSGQVTKIGDNFFTTATNVTDIYIDNTEGEVELPTIPEGVTIHYKDEFRLSDLIVDSMVAGNTKLLNLENTFSGLINGDEVAY